MPQVLRYTEGSVETGSRVSFRLYAINFNGMSEVSDTFTFSVCTEPEGMPAPYKVSSSANELNLAWNEPQDDGGCPLTGFAIYRDDGEGGEVVTEVNTDNDSEIRNNPILRQATITNFPAGSVGQYFRYKMVAFNREGSTDSALVTVLNAGPPNTPSSAPLLTDQTDTYITVSLPLISDDDNGGSDIVSYNIQMDDARGGDYVSVGGEDPISMQTEYTLANVTRGQTYRIRYRVKNGDDETSWSDYSPVLFALAAGVPDPPPPPALGSATADSITLEFSESGDSGGSKVLGYELWMDEGTYGTEFSKVESYLGSLMTHTLSVAVDADNIVSGSVYTFQYRSRNVIGDSEFSTEVRYAVSSPPGQPAAPTKNYLQSTRTSLLIEWSESQATETSIIGYRLYMSAGTSQYEVVYDGNDNALLREYEITGTSAGQLY